MTPVDGRAPAAAGSTKAPDSIVTILPSGPSGLQASTTPSSSLQAAPGSAESDPSTVHSSRPADFRSPSPPQAHASPAAAAARATLPRRWTSSSSPSSTSADAEHQHQHQRRRGTVASSLPTTLRRVASGIRRFTGPSRAAALDDEEDWSVFEEVMTHEGTTHPSSSSPPPASASASSSPSRSPHAQRPREPEGGLVAPPPIHVTVTVPTPVAGEAGFAASAARWTRSPASDARLEDDDRLLPPLERGSSTGTERRASRSRARSPDTEPSSSSTSSLKDADREGHGLGGRGSSSSSSSSSWRRRRSRLPTPSTLHRNILKCSLAYFLGSLFTYYPPLSRFISELSQDGPGEKYPSAMGHMVATVAVYYNPAKTLGGMMEADIYCIMGLAFASFISLGSMRMYRELEPHAGWEWLADALVLIWVGVGMSLVAWFKLWIAKPTFNPAASMTSIILFVVVVKEGGLEMLLQVALIVAIGAFISNLVCVGLWPQYAKKILQANMIKTLDSFSTLLSLLTSTFLLEDESYQPSQERISKAVADHQAAFTGLKKSLDEARSERLSGGPIADFSRGGGDPYEDAVDSLTRLAQHLNGLRSGTSLQYDLAKAHRDAKVAIRQHSAATQGTVIPNVLETDLAKGKAAVEGHGNTEGVMLRAAAAMFGDLVSELDSPLRALSSTCTKALCRLRGAFSDRESTSADTESVLDEFMELANGIQRALFEFDSTSNHAVLRLYRRIDASGSTLLASPASTSAEENIGPFISGSDNEHVLLVYFFIFAMQEFARELISLTVAMSRIYAAERPTTSRRWFPRITTALSIVFRCVRSRVKTSISESRSRQSDTSASSKPVRRGLHRRISGILTKEKSRITYSFPKVRPHAPDTVQTPSRKGLPPWRRFQLSLWAFGSHMQDYAIKYAIKTGVATAILAAPAFIEATRPTFMEYRGEWALISFFVVMSPTIGATNFLSMHRILGTLFGAFTAATAYTMFHKTPAVLAIFGLIFSMPCFYYIVAKPQYATTGRFVLLTYNLTCLYSYNSRQLDISVVDIAFHRSTAVTVGVLWAGFVSRFWWPSEARRELSKQLGEFCLNIGWLYTHLVASNSFSSEDRTDGAEPEADEPNEETALLPRKLNNSIEEFMAMELHLQIQLLGLQDLLKQTRHEPRLKGPFPIKLYRSILASLQTILDKLHSMRCVTTREEWYTSVRRDFIIPVNKERREMVGNIILYFSTLASAFRLKAPMPPYLPPAEKARQQLVEAIRKLDVVKNREIRGSRQLLYFAYALTMKGITRELDFLGRTSQDAFGVIGQSTEVFDRMFLVDVDNRV